MFILIHNFAAAFFPITINSSILYETPVIKPSLVISILISLSYNLIADESELTDKWKVADGGYRICDTEQRYRQLLHYALYGVGNMPPTGCMLAPAGASVKINHCIESDIILCQFTFTPVSGSSIEGWASKALLREIVQ